MKKLNSLWKVCAVVLFALMVFSSCVKNDIPVVTNTPDTEAAAIQDWLTTMVSKGMNIDTTSTGLYYIVTKAGSGPTVKTGDTLTVKYTGMLLNGAVFDASYLYAADSTFIYVHKDTDPTKRLIQGFEEGVEVMNKGEQAAFLIPSAKAYGSTGSGAIPPYTPLLFVIEIKNIK